MAPRSVEMVADRQVPERNPARSLICKTPAGDDPYTTGLDSSVWSAACRLRQAGTPWALRTKTARPTLDGLEVTEMARADLINNNVVPLLIAGILSGSLSATLFRPGAESKGGGGANAAAEPENRAAPGPPSWVADFIRSSRPSVRPS